MLTQTLRKFDAYLYNSTVFHRSTPAFHTEMFGEYPNMHSFPVVLIDVFWGSVFLYTGIAGKGEANTTGSVIALRRDGNLSV